MAKEDRFSNDVDGAAYFERCRARDAGEDRDYDAPTRWDVDGEHVCDECGDELDSNGHCGYCDGDND